MEQRDVHVMVPADEYERLRERHGPSGRLISSRGIIITLICLPFGLALLSIAASVPFLISALIDSQAAVRDIAVTALESRQPTKTSMTRDDLVVGLMVICGLAFVLRGIR